MTLGNYQIFNKRYIIYTEKGKGKKYDGYNNYLFMKMTTKMEKEMEKEKNTFCWNHYYLKVNTKMGKNGMEKNMIQIGI